MLTLEANYSKKIGLPGYSSHQFMVMLRTEITDLNAVQAESDRLYGLLQTAVDASLQKVGWLPPATPKNGNGGGHRQENPDRWVTGQFVIMNLTQCLALPASLNQNMAGCLSGDLRDLRLLSKDTMGEFVLHG